MLTTSTFAQQETSSASQTQTQQELRIKLDKDRAEKKKTQNELKMKIKKQEAEKEKSTESELQEGSSDFERCPGLMGLALGYCEGGKNQRGQRDVPSRVGLRCVNR